MAGCLFCEIISGKIKSEFVYEDNDTVAFRDINPKAPVHILIIPKKHIASLNEISDSDNLILGKICNVAKQLATKFSIDNSGYRLIYNTGSDAGQAVAHIHIHLMGGRKFSWPPG